MVKDMAANVETMMQHKIDAIKVRKALHALILVIDIYLPSIIVFSCSESWNLPRI